MGYYLFFKLLRNKRLLLGDCKDSNNSKYTLNN